MSVSAARRCHCNVIGRLGSVALVLVLALAGSALGDIAIDGSGQVTGWGVTPFTQGNQANQSNGDTYFTIADDYAPIDYPNIGRVPSPGGTRGEGFDLEEMYMRTVGNQLEVLLVTSSAYEQTVGGTAYRLGDLFLEIDGATFGIVTQEANQGLAAGSVYGIFGADDVQVLQQAGGSYLGKTSLRGNDYGPPATVEDVAGPWAVHSDIEQSQWLGTAVVDTALFDYGGDEDGTFLIQYVIGLDLLGGSDYDDATAHVAWGCGNDTIEVEAPTPIPEPATMALLGIGVFGLMIRRRK